MMSNRPPYPRTSLAFVAALSITVASCDRGAPSIPLPPKDDLYAYSLAVAQRTAADIVLNRAMALYNIGNVHHVFGRGDEALAYFDQALAIDDTIGMIHLRKARVLLAQEREFDKALAAFRAGLEHDPSLAGALTGMGMVMNHQGRFADSIPVLEKEIEKGTGSANTHYFLAQAFGMEKNLSRSVEHYRQALKLDPSHQNARYNLGRALRATKQDTEAEVVEKEFKKRKDEMAARDLEEFQRKDDLAKQNRLTAETLWDSAAIYLMESRATRATKERAELAAKVRLLAEESLTFNASQPDVLDFLFAEYQSIGDSVRTGSIAEKIATELPTNPQLLLTTAGYLSKLGGKKPSRENIQKQRGLLDRAVELAPEAPGPHLALATLLLFHDRSRQSVSLALSHAQKSLKSARNPSPMNYDILAYAQFQSGDRPAALTTLKQGTERFPGNPPLTQRLSALSAQ